MEEIFRILEDKTQRITVHLFPSPCEWRGTDRLIAAFPEKVNPKCFTCGSEFLTLDVQRDLSLEGLVKLLESMGIPAPIQSMVWVQATEFLFEYGDPTTGKTLLEIISDLDTKTSPYPAMELFIRAGPEKRTAIVFLYIFVETKYKTLL